MHFNSLWIYNLYYTKFEGLFFNEQTILKQDEQIPSRIKKKTLNIKLNKKELILKYFESEISSSKILKVIL